MRSAAGLRYHVLNVAMHAAVVLGTTLAILGALAAVWLFAGWIVFREFDVPEPVAASIAFESEAWRDPGSAASGLRYRMHRDLLRRYDLVGMPRQDLVGLLGEPEKSSQSASYFYPMRGEVGSSGVRGAALHVWFDLQDRVSKTRMSRRTDATDQL